MTDMHTSVRLGLTTPEADAFVDRGFFSEDLLAG